MSPPPNIPPRWRRQFFRGEGSVARDEEEEVGNGKY